jgi:hypothetical protein
VDAEGGRAPSVQSEGRPSQVQPEGSRAPSVESVRAEPGAAAATAQGESHSDEDEERERNTPRFAHVKRFVSGRRRGGAERFAAWEESGTPNFLHFDPSSEKNLRLDPRKF